MNSLPLTPVGLLVGTLVAVFLMAAFDLGEMYGALIVAATTVGGYGVDLVRRRSQ